MPFTPGNAHSKGRPKGAKNRFTTLKQYLEQNDIDLNKEFWENVYPELSPAEKAKTLVAMRQYLEPKLTQTDMVLTGDEPRVVVQFTAIQPTAVQPAKEVQPVAPTGALPSSDDSSKS